MIRNQPTWRIPVGILALLASLAIYGTLVAWFVPPLIQNWSALAQTPVYLALGLLWLLPLGRFLIWMETGRWSAPDKP